MADIIEIMPDDMPIEVREAMEQGNLTAYACELQERCYVFEKAIARATEKWQQENPGLDFWPSFDDLLVWLAKNDDVAPEADGE